MNLGCQSVIISGDISLTSILTLLFLRYHNQIFLNNCCIYGRQKVLLGVTALLGMRRSFTGFDGNSHLVVVVVVVAHIYPVTGQRQTLTCWTIRILFIILTTVLRDWRNPHLLKSFRWFNVPVDFSEFLSTEFAACSKPPSKDTSNDRTASYPRTQQHDQGGGLNSWSCDQSRRENDAFTLSATLHTLVDFQS